MLGSSVGEAERMAGLSVCHAASTSFPANRPDPRDDHLKITFS
jgi:hypothetical protein